MQQEFCFDHERLEVYQEAISFIGWLSLLLEATLRAGDVKDQLERASTSIPLNIAEGNGKYSPKDRCRFFDIAHGSALECAAGLDILVARAKLTQEQIRPGKVRLQKIVRMLIGLIKRNSTREYERATGSNRIESKKRATPMRAPIRMADCTSKSTLDRNANPARALALALNPIPTPNLHLNLSRL